MELQSYLNNGGFITSWRRQTMASKQNHVTMFPWLAFGHMLPYLELSKRLAEKGLFVSFISTSRNLQRLPPIPTHLSDKIKLVEISLPLTSLPEGCEATVDLQPQQIQYLKKACDGLQAPFEMLVQSDPPDLILFDFVHCWIPTIAAKLGVPCAFFSAYNASVMAFVGPTNELKSPRQRTKPEDYTKPPTWFPFPSLIAHRPDQAPEIFRNLNFPDMSGKSGGQRWGSTLEGCQFIAVRSCREFEGAYLDHLEQLYQKPVLPVGLLPPKFAYKNLQQAGSEWSSTFKWLDKQEPKSVVFIGFGTEYKMPIGLVHELAYGIELSSLPFIWILQKPEGLNIPDLLPGGFLGRTSGKGTICLGWAPQLQILAHPAIGGCLFHAGWSSIIESLGFGHPQILMPMVADQGLNSKLLVEKGVGYEVPRNEDGSFNRDAVAKSMRLVMVEEEGMGLRLKAAHLQTIFANQDLQDHYISNFIHHMCNHK